MILFWIALAIALLALLAAYICYRMAFYSPARKPFDPNEFNLPEGDEYAAYRESIKGWIQEMRDMPCEEFEIKSFDGLTLRAKYYEYAPGAPIELMFHGYRSSGERDLCGGIKRCRKLGRSSLIVDQRGCGRSDGNVITFGVNEHRDCLSWVNFMVEHFGPDVKILLCGISMGAATVTIAAGQPLPANVIGALADCGYTSARDMIEKTIGEMKLPPKLMFPFVKLGAKLFGKFDLEAVTPLEAVTHATVPIIFIHGEADNFVPCWMSQKNFDACSGKKAILTIPEAAHGLSYLTQPAEYRQALADFFGPDASATIL